MTSIASSFIYGFFDRFGIDFSLTKISTYKTVPEEASKLLYRQTFFFKKRSTRLSVEYEITLYLRDRKIDLVYLLYHIYILVTLMFYVYVAKSKIVNFIELLYDIYQNRE